MEDLPEEKDARLPGLWLGDLRLSGSLTQTFRYRRAAAGEDQDLYGHIDVRGAFPDAGREPRSWRGPVSFGLQASYNLDIDSFQSAGSVGGNGFFPFLDVTNTFGDRLTAFLHAAYLEVDDLLLFDRVRAGRQFIHREESIIFDGAHVRTRRWKSLALEAYGGLPVHLYESSASGDALGGLSIDARPSADLTLGADYVFLRDARDELPDSEGHLYVVRGAYRFGTEWRLNASASWIDDRERRQMLDLRYVSTDWGLLASLRLLRQNALVDFQTSELSPFLLVEGRYEPYYQAELDLHQPIGERFGTGIGAKLRQLADPDGAGVFNHSFRNAYVAFDARDLWQGMALSVRGDAWDADGEDIYAAGLELEQEIGMVRLRLGTSYSLYLFDPLTGTERNRDRVYYAKARWRLRRGLDLDTEYQYEKDSITEYHVVRVGLRLWF